MLILHRYKRQWTELVHQSGDAIRIKVDQVEGLDGGKKRVTLLFDDAQRNFEVYRPEAKRKEAKACRTAR